MHPDEERGGFKVIEGGKSTTEQGLPKELEKLMDLDAEASVLSCIMATQGASLDEVRVFLEAEHFYSEAHRRMYEGCCAVREAGGIVDIVTVATWLREQGRLAQVGGMSYLTTVSNFAPSLSAKAQRQYAVTVRDRYVRRQFKLLGTQIQASCSYEDTPVELLLSASLQAMQDLTVKIGRSEKSAEIRDVLKRTIDRIHALAISGGRGLVPTGFDGIDRITIGLHEEFAVIAARPGMGKTSLMCQIGVNVASITDDAGKHPFGVYLASLETNDETLLMRVLCAEGTVSLARVRTGTLTPADWTNLHNATARLMNLPVWIDDTAGMTVQELWAKCRRARAALQAKGQRLALVAVDYLQLLRLAISGLRGQMPSREQVVSEVARTMVSMANDLNCAVVALSQLNRKCEERGKDKRPVLSDLRESGEIEQAARTIIFLYREGYYDRHADQNEAEAIVAKQNNGPTGVASLHFDPAYARFSNQLEEEEWAHGRSKGGGGAGGMSKSNGHAAAAKTNGHAGPSKPMPTTTAPAAPPPPPQAVREPEEPPVEELLVVREPEQIEMGDLVEFNDGVVTHTEQLTPEQRIEAIEHPMARSGVRVLLTLVTPGVTFEVLVKLTSEKLEVRPGDAKGLIEVALKSRLLRVDGEGSQRTFYKIDG